MKTPKFWQTQNIITTVLTPFSVVYNIITQLRLKTTRPYKSKAKVICVGNITAGGVGKTPVAIALAKKYQQENKKVFFLTRGYKGQLKNVLVDLENMDAKKTGDEARLLATIAPTIIAPKRDKGAKMAEKLGAEIIIMDDGFQNPQLYKDESILVFNGTYGIGNGKIIPAGPLREHLNTSLKRANSVIIMGDDKTNLKEKLQNFPCKTGYLVPTPHDFCTKKVYAFAGIGSPQKFYQTLKDEGINVIKTKDFEDHHNYLDEELDNIIIEAQNNNLIPITTEKDYVKINPRYHDKIHCLKVNAVIKDN